MRAIAEPIIRTAPCRRIADRCGGTFAVGWPSTTSGDAESVLAPLGGWIDDYDRQAPHSALGMRPAEYRASLKLMPLSVQGIGEQSLVGDASASQQLGYTFAVILVGQRVASRTPSEAQRYQNGGAPGGVRP
jgi:hypothetical protein